MTGLRLAAELYVEDLNMLGMDTARKNIKALQRIQEGFGTVTENPGRLQESFSAIPQHSLIAPFEINCDLV